MADLFKKSDMVYQDYQWTTIKPDDPRISGKPDSTELNRREGYEVLYFVNKLAEEWGFKQLESCKKIEFLIRNKVPREIHSQEKIKNWISLNWKTI